MEMAFRQGDRVLWRETCVSFVKRIPQTAKMAVVSLSGFRYLMTESLTGQFLVAYSFVTAPI
jgi:hypothetical protein